MKKSIFVSALLMMVPSIGAYKLQIFNKTPYPLQAIVKFEDPVVCSSMVFNMRPISMIEREMTCCIDVIKIMRTDPDVLNRIEYEYQQVKNNQGACTDTTVMVTVFSNDLLKIE